MRPLIVSQNPKKQRRANIEYITAQEAADITGLTQNSIGDKARAGDIPNVQKFGNAWMIPKEWAETYTRAKPGRKPRGNEDKEFLQKILEQNQNKG